MELNSCGSARCRRSSARPDRGAAQSEICRAQSCRRVSSARTLSGQAHPAAHPWTRRLGDVETVGSRVENIRVGETVGILRCETGVEKPGTLAEKVVVPLKVWSESLSVGLSKKWPAHPSGLLNRLAGLTPVERSSSSSTGKSVLLVTGASGGVGVASVLLGKSMD